MKLSKKFLNDYLDVNDLDFKQVADDMTNVGNEYASREKLINATKLVIGKVLECNNHPDSDHLHVCKVDIGKEILDIVNANWEMLAKKYGISRGQIEDMRPAFNIKKTLH